ncbi:hypothetical protein M885DRAFT_102125 [Pelagophyceae sp. CCMP2097]|nr:hypothetical protein M885DRAFT_102125 [Pelagophyceae sp. CCMP2097]
MLPRSTPMLASPGASKRPARTAPFRAPSRRPNRSAGAARCTRQRSTWPTRRRARRSCGRPRCPAARRASEATRPPHCSVATLQKPSRSTRARSSPRPTRRRSSSSGQRRTRPQGSTSRRSATRGAPCCSGPPGSTAWSSCRGASARRDAPSPPKRSRSTVTSSGWAARRTFRGPRKTAASTRRRPGRRCRRARSTTRKREATPRSGPSSTFPPSRRTRTRCASQSLPAAAKRKSSPPSTRIAPPPQQAWARITMLSWTASRQRPLRRNGSKATSVSRRRCARWASREAPSKRTTTRSASNPATCISMPRSATPSPPCAPQHSDAAADRPKGRATGPAEMLNNTFMRPCMTSMAQRGRRVRGPHRNAGPRRHLSRNSAIFFRAKRFGTRSRLERASFVKGDVEAPATMRE